MVHTKADMNDRTVVTVEKKTKFTLGKHFLDRTKFMLTVKEKQLISFDPNFYLYPKTLVVVFCNPLHVAKRSILVRVGATLLCECENRYLECSYETSWLSVWHL